MPPPADSYGLPLPFGLHRLIRGLNALGTLWIVALMLLINSDVLGRNLLGAPVRGVTELVSLSIVGIVFLQLADTLHSGRFTRAEVLLDRLERSRRRARRCCRPPSTAWARCSWRSSCGPPGRRWSNRCASASTSAPSATSPRRCGRCG